LLGDFAVDPRHNPFLDPRAEDLDFDPLADIAPREVGFPEEAVVFGQVLERLLPEPNQFSGNLPPRCADAHFRCLPLDPGDVEQFSERGFLELPVAVAARLRRRPASLLGCRLDQGMMKIGFGKPHRVTRPYPGDNRDRVRWQFDG
jgi:hypothetical protein